MSLVNQNCQARFYNSLVALLKISRSIAESMENAMLAFEWSKQIL